MNHSVTYGNTTVHNIQVHNDQQQLTGGFQSNGNFILSATTQADEWTTPWPLALVVAGNRTGQWCSVHLELTNQGSQAVASGSTLFSALPAAFQPQSRVVLSVSVWSPRDTGPFAVTPATLVFEPLSRSVLFYGVWEPQEVLMGTLVYFCAER